MELFRYTIKWEYGIRMKKNTSEIGKAFKISLIYLRYIINEHLMHNNKKLLILIYALIMGVVSNGYAQLQTLSSHYFLNQQTINPGSVGAEGGINIFLNYRGQWVGLEGAPHTVQFSADMSLPMISSGVGVSLTNDIIGAERHTAVRLNYAYYLKINKAYQLGFGVGAGIINTSIDGSKLTTPDGNDGVLPQGQFGLIRPDIAIGIYLKNKNLNIGLSYNSILRNATIEGVESALDTRYSSYFNLYASYSIDLPRKMNLTPSAQVRTDFKNWQTDLGVLFNWNNYIFTGVFLRGYNKPSIDAFYATVGFKPIDKLAIFYAYDVGLSGLSNVHNGSHEISIKFSIPEDKLFKKGKVIYNPRYL